MGLYDQINAIKQQAKQKISSELTPSIPTFGENKENSIIPMSIKDRENIGIAQQQADREAYYNAEKLGYYLDNKGNKIPWSSLPDKTIFGIPTGEKELAHYSTEAKALDYIQSPIDLKEFYEVPGRLYTSVDNEGNLILKATKTGQEGVQQYNEIQQAGATIYNRYGPSKANAPIVVDFLTGMYNSMNRFPTNLTDFATFIEDTGEGVYSWITTGDYEPKYSKLNEVADKWTNYWDSFREPEALDVQQPYSLDWFASNIGAGISSLLQFQAAGAPISAFSKAATMGKIGTETAMRLGMFGGSAIMNVGEAYRTAAENGLSLKDRTLFTLPVAAINSAIELGFGANTLMKYMVKGGGYKMVPKIVAEEIGEEFTEETVKKGTQRALARVWNSVENFTKTPLIGQAFEEGVEEFTQSLTQSTGQVLYDMIAPEKKFNMSFDGELFGQALQEGIIGSIVGGLGGAAMNRADKKNSNRDFIDYIGAGKEKELLDRINVLEKQGNVSTEKAENFRNKLNYLVNLRDTNRKYFNNFLQAENYQEAINEGLVAMDTNTQVVDSLKEDASTNSAWDTRSMRETMINSIFTHTDNQLEDLLKGKGLNNYIKALNNVRENYTLLKKVSKNPQLNEHLLRLYTQQNELVDRGFKITKEIDNISNILSRSSNINNISNYIKSVFNKNKISSLNKIKEELNNSKETLSYLSKSKEETSKYIDNLIKELEIEEEGKTFGNLPELKKLEGLDKVKELAELSADNDSKINLFDNQINLLQKNKEVNTLLKEVEDKKIEEDKKEQDRIKAEQKKLSDEATQEVRFELEEAEDIVSLKNILQRVEQSIDMKEPNKKLVTAQIQAKIRLKEAEQAKLNKVFKTKPSTIEDEIAQGEVEFTIGEETTEDTQAETYEQVTEEPVEYDIDRKQEGREDKLEESEDKLAESEFKTPYVNIAYLAIDYDEKAGTIRSKLDANKRLVFNKEEQSLPSLPNEYNEGTKLIMYVYEGHDEYTKSQFEAYKDDIDNIPIAIQSEEDYNAGKQPFLFVHKMNWITPQRVAEHAIEQVTEETHKLREFVVNSNSPVSTSVVSKSGGWINKPPKGTKNPNYYTLREIISDDTRPVIAFGDKLGNLDANIEAENAHNVVSGIPYLVLPRANNTNFAIWLKQEPIKNNSNFSKYIQTVTKIFEEYNKDLNGDKSQVDIKSIQELREEIGKYFHVNTDKIDSDKLLKNEKKDYIFRVSEDPNNEAEITVYTNKRLINYKYKKGSKGYFWQKSGKNITTSSVKDINEELSKWIGNKYPNITKKGVEAGSNFEVYEIQDGNLVKVKKNYIDFLSENRVVTSTVQPRVINGVRTYFSQPNIRINTDINKIKILKPAEEKKDNLEAKKADIERRRQEELKRKLNYAPKIKRAAESVMNKLGISEIDALTYLRTNTNNPFVVDLTKEFTNDDLDGIIGIRNYLRDYASKEIDKINAKYDAELAALEKSTESLEVTEKIPTFEELFPEGLPDDINIDEIFSEQDKQDANDIMKHCKGTSSSSSKNKKVRTVKK